MMPNSGDKISRLQNPIYCQGQKDWVMEIWSSTQIFLDYQHNKLFQKLQNKERPHEALHYLNGAIHKMQTHNVHHTMKHSKKKEYEYEEEF